MNRIGFAARASTVAVGTALLLGVAGMAMAEENHGDKDVDVSVGITALPVGEALAMTVSGTTPGTTTLGEEGSTATMRQFNSTLPTVTVTDTRDPGDIPAGAGWYVLGTATDFTGDAGQPAISASHLGWAPRILSGGESGQVVEGERVDTVMDSAPITSGLVDQELLALAIDSGAIASERQWTVTADLFLRVPVTVAAGDYTSTLTLSLFE
ncbi:hypothetical protein [Arthrobacter sp. 35W]|uniref:hypothetical protein n=1 Tax=Arthrobacter sp. 35W TaxID=1132441 RepID=UPI00040A59FF|nr:hypothetical protein [Arthrobacter sp. 35W]